MAPTTLPRLFAISDRRSLPGGDLSPWLDALAEAGVDGVQIREKDLDDLALYELTRKARRRLPASTCLLVNGRLDIALAAGADGVHLPVNGPPPGLLRRRFGNRVILGCSTHSFEEARRAREGGADFITFGPIFPTPSKEAYGPPPGLGGLKALLQELSSSLPVFGLGGLSPEDLPALADAGAAGAAGIGMFRTGSAARAAVAKARTSFSGDSES